MKNIPQLTFMNNNSELYFQIAFLLRQWVGWDGGVGIVLLVLSGDVGEMHHSLHCKYVFLRGTRAG